MNFDSTICGAIRELVDGLVKATPKSSKLETCILPEREALEIAEQLERIVASKLPDNKNIKHDGYKIAATGLVARLKVAASTRSRYSAPWSQIVNDAKKINNISDRVYVLMLLAQALARCEHELALKLVQDAEGPIKHIPNLIDRADRLEMAAAIYRELGDETSAKSIVREALVTLQQCPWDQRRDNLTEQTLQLAHKIQPEFAASLSPLIENPLVEHREKLQQAARTLHRKPQQAEIKRERQNLEPDDWEYVLGKMGRHLLRALNSGGTTRPLNEASQLALEALDLEFEQALPLFAWTAQNLIQTTSQKDTITGLHNASIQIVVLCKQIADLLLRSQGKMQLVAELVAPSNLKLFKHGHHKEAIESIEEWLQSNSADYIKIYDPYFKANDLELLKSIKDDTQVFIITSWKAQKGVEVGDRATLETIYRKQWRSASNNSPAPWIQVIVVGTKSGDTPIHNRYVVTQGGKGVRLSTSISGLGISDSEIDILDADEAKMLEIEFIDPHINFSLRVYKDERIITHAFMLI